MTFVGVFDAAGTPQTKRAATPRASTESALGAASHERRWPALAEFHRVALVHLEAAFRFAYRLSRDAAIAQDLTQETYLRAWRAFERFDRSANARAWLFGILYHVWQHERRTLARTPVLVDSTALRHEAAAWDPPTPQHLTDDEVLMALDRLSEAMRDTVLLADVEELSYRAVSEVMGVPIGTVMSRLNRGRYDCHARPERSSLCAGVARLPLKTSGR